MRKLSVRHKKYLDRVATSYQWSACCWEDLSQVDRDRLEQIGDYETLWCDAIRYLNDKYWERRNKGEVNR